MIAGIAPTMFTRFRQNGRRLQVSLVETRQVKAKVRHEHIANLGLIDTPVTIAGRFVFWQRLHERLGRLDKRLDLAARATTPQKPGHVAWARAMSSKANSVTAKQSANFLKFLHDFAPLEAPNVLLITDHRTSARYCECHVKASKVIALGTTDVPLDPEEQAEYRAN